MRIILILLVLLSSSVSWAQSAKRGRFESWKVVAQRHFTWHLGLANSEIHALGTGTTSVSTLGTPEMAYTQKRKWQEIDKILVPEWKQTSDDFETAFRRLRDHRFIKGSEPDFPRRITWLYPDDGCFLRAEWMDRLTDEWGYQHGAKIFVFGDLKVKTDNARDGEVTWWYHVALTYQKDGKSYVFDAAVEPRRPLLVEEWLGLMSSTPDDLGVAICGRGTMGPFEDCQNQKIKSMAELEKYQKTYLDSEWWRMVDLKRDPKKVLGEEPPWLEGSKPMPQKPRLSIINIP